MPSKLVEKRNELMARQKALAEMRAEAGPDRDYGKIKALETFKGTKAKVEELQRVEKELADLTDEVLALKEAERIFDESEARDEAFKAGGAGMQHASGQPQSVPQEPKGFGDHFVESKAFTEYKGGGIGPVGRVDVEVKTNMTTAAGWAPESLRTGRVVLSAQRPIRVVNLIPKANTNSAAIVYMVESTFTNNAAEVAEAGTYGEAALALTETTETVRKFGVWLPITDEQLDDVSFVRDYVNQRLGYMLEARLDSELLVGDGTPPNISGVHDRANIQTQAKGADNDPDAVFKAMTLVRSTGFAEPTAAVFHPTDWQEIRLLRTGDGIYIWGAPMDAGPARIWGLPVVVTTAETVTQALVGDFAQYSQMAIRKGMEFQITNSHDTYFILGRQAIRMDMRLAFMVYRHEAFCEITGL